jgi:TPR repeat protein
MKLMVVFALLVFSIQQCRGQAANSSNGGDPFGFQGLPNPKGMLDYGLAALRGLNNSAGSGEARSQNELGNCYYQGLSVDQDFPDAVHWYRKAAIQDYAPAQDNLGEMYEHGRGVLEDFVEAAKWYRRAAEEGYWLAQFHLGIMYDKGRGVRQNFILAHLWLNLSAANRPPTLSRADAQERLMESLGGSDPRTSRERVAQKMSPEQIAKAQMLARNWKPFSGTLHAVPNHSGSGVPPPYR